MIYKYAGQVVGLDSIAIARLGLFLIASRYGFWLVVSLHTVAKNIETKIYSLWRQDRRLTNLNEHYEKDDSDY